MFGKLNEQAASALLSLEPGDLSYCLKLAKRFEHMGIESDQASNALCTLVESGELETIYQAGEAYAEQRRSCLRFGTSPA